MSTGITPRAVPQRLLVRKAIWRSDPKVLLVDSSDPRVAQLHRLLAGNQRLEYLCGYHWAFDFEYAPGVVETILINEQCESFRHNGKETWALLSDFVREATDAPTHHMVIARVRDPQGKLAVERDIERQDQFAFNVASGGPNLFVVSRTPWSEQYARALKRSSSGIVEVDQVAVTHHQ